MLIFLVPFYFFICSAFAASSPFNRLRSSAFGFPGVNASYDYVVVGGGTAGLTIAARLAETASVAVIEAGGFYEVDNSNSSTVPLLALTYMPFLYTTTDYQRQPLMDWGLISKPQSRAGNRQIHYAQGKTLGGSSAINTMSYMRSTVGSHKLWAKKVGDQGYTFQNLLKYFKKSCHLTPPNEGKRNAANATVQYDPAAFDNSKGGPLQVSWNNWVDPTISWIAKAIQAVGLGIDPKGFSSGRLSGGSWVPSTINPEGAIRSSAYSSFLEEAIETTDIMVYPHTQALKILFDSSSPPKATGVSVSTQGLQYSIMAKKEVIVSAGVFHSPQLLMVSGVGPQETLESFNIPVLSNLPGVGQNLWDPISFVVAYPVSTTSGAAITSNSNLIPSVLQQYLNNAAGPYSSAAGYLTYEKFPSSLRKTFSNRTISALASFPVDWPELEYVAASLSGGNGTTWGVIGCYLVTPLSRGNVTITSASMTDPPSIDLGWLTDRVDEEQAVAALKRVRQIWNTTPASSIKSGAELFPGASVTSDEDILEYIQANSQQAWHGSSTCSMGKQSDPSAVVDSKARVFGVEGLRVVDASIFPFALPSHPQGSVYMIAEKIADDIKNGN